MVEISRHERMKIKVRSIIGEGREAEHHELVSLYMKFPITYQEWEVVLEKMKKRFGVPAYRTGYWVFMPKQNGELLMNEYQEGQYQFVQLKKGPEEMDIKLEDAAIGQPVHILEGEEKDVVAMRLNHDPAEGDYVVAVLEMAGDMKFSRGDMLWLPGNTKVRTR